MTSSILLQNATLLLHDSNDHILPTRSSLLIENNKIAQIAPSITPPPNCKILDCTNKIVSPGFIDTHRHTWQTQLKGRHSNDLLLDYMPTGNMAAHLYTPDDIYWGQLSGSLESLDAGTTTIIDHAHMNYSAEHNDEAIRGFSDSGIRGVFCYCANPRVKEWSEFEVEGDVFPEWWWEQMRRFAREQPFAEGRIKLGLGWDSFYLPREMVVNVFEEIRGMGVKLITCHHVSTPTLSTSPSPLSLCSCANVRFQSNSTAGRLGINGSRYPHLPCHRSNRIRTQPPPFPRRPSKFNTQHRTPNVVRNPQMFPSYSPRNLQFRRRLPQFLFRRYSRPNASRTPICPRHTKPKCP